MMTGHRPEPTLGFVLKGYPRISETFISNEILLLESLGFRVHIFSMRKPREAFTHESIRSIKAGVDYLPSTILGNLKPLVWHNFRVAARRPAVYGRALKKALKRWTRTRTSATFKHLLQAGYLVDRLLEKSGAVHLHAHFAHSPTSVALFASMLSGLPFSFFAHAKDIYTSDPRQLREKIGLARFVVTCTRYNQAYLTRLAAGLSTRVQCVYHGINLSYFTPPENRPACKPPYRLLTVARMTEKKGLPVVYQALAVLRDRGLDVTHTLIGDGDDKESVRRLIRDLGLEDRATLAGTLAHEQVIGHYATSDLFVLGCRIAQTGDRDGIPNVMAEAMAMGLPVVATRVSGIPEFLEHEVTGLMAEPDDPAGLADLMERLLTDEPLRRKVSLAARKRIQDRFDNRRLIMDLAEIYRKGIPALGIEYLQGSG